MVLAWKAWTKNPQIVLPQTTHSKTTVRIVSTPIAKTATGMPLPETSAPFASATQRHPPPATQPADHSSKLHAAEARKPTTHVKPCITMATTASDTCFQTKVCSLRGTTTLTMW